MSDSVYKVIEIIGTSKDSWENAAKVAVERASKTLRDLRVAEVVHQDLDNRGWQSRSLPDEAERVVQVCGLTGHYITLKAASASFKSTMV